MNLFEPVQYGRFHAKNVFSRAASKEQLNEDDGHIVPEVYAFYEELAKGGLGTIIVSSARVKLFSHTVPQGLFRLDRTDLLPDYKKLADIGHKYGVTMIIQATYSHFDINEMTIQDLNVIPMQYAAAAKFAEDCGFDGIEIHEAHNMFMATVCNPTINHRSDEYGRNIHLLTKKCIKAIREVTKPDFILISKIDSSNAMVNYTEEMSIDHCRELEKAGIDVIEVSGGEVAKKVTTTQEESYFKDFAIRLKKEGIRTPLMLVGGNKSVEVISKLHDEYGIELFSMSRATTREFDLINRWASGDLTPSKCLSCFACWNTYGHLCPFNKANPFDCHKTPEHAINEPVVKDDSAQFLATRRYQKEG